MDQKITPGKLPDGLQLAVNALVWHSVGCDGYKVEIDAIRAEHAKRLTLQHNAADQAQRIAELEAERATTAAHIASIARQLGDKPLQVDDIAVRVLAVAVERDALRTRLAELERQGPVAFREHITGRLAAEGDEHRDRFPMAYAPLYARPVPAIPSGWRLVNDGALAMVVNALRRDADAGLTVRGEMADELVKAAPEAAR